MCVGNDGFGAGSSAWYTDERQAVERSVRIGVLPGMTERPRVQIPPGPPKTQDLTRRLARKRYPPGGSRIVSKEKKTKEKRIQSFGGGFDSGNCGVPIELGCSKDTGGAEEE